MRFDHIILNKENNNLSIDQSHFSFSFLTNVVSDRIIKEDRILRKRGEEVRKSDNVVQIDVTNEIIVYHLLGLDIMNRWDKGGCVRVYNQI